MTQALLQDKNRQTISRTVTAGLCTACGTCEGVCPQSAIKMYEDKNRGNFFPRINFQKCINCGVCLRCCPGESVDFKQLNLELFGKEPADFLVGNFLDFYVSNSTNYEIRYNSSSGGLITELLIYALEKRIIDGAIVTRMSDQNPLRPEIVLAKTKEEIVAASKSKYCPVPTNVVLKEVLKTDGRFAIVGLPCHIQGVKKAISVNKKIGERILFTFGLMCSYNRNFLATEYILKKLCIKKDDVAVLDYRGQGYLGYLCVKLKNGQKISVPYTQYYNKWLRSFLYLPRCTMCLDHTAELADISFGDNWMPNYQKESVGSSILISRTASAENLIANALADNRIDLTKTKSSEVIASKKGALIRKRNYISARIEIFKLLGKKTPFYNQSLPTGTPSAYIDAIITYLQIFLAQKRFLWRFLDVLAISLNLAANTLKKKQ
ncbi:MAG: Coenzyme F420 hydrogenase/dehydrogenase, beta subunit C-terminal domain [Candidatus Bathyarchaeota archaeon]|nr:Coenzyme F420 hydrogenase/dehydrogenase, beta subunit C-terminal domain [Candidatus Bathyarchaeota archaeon]